MEQELKIEQFLEKNKHIDDSILIESLKKKAIIQERIIQSQKSHIETISILKNRYFDQLKNLELEFASLQLDNKNLQKMIKERCGHDEFLENKPVGNE